MNSALAYGALGLPLAFAALPLYVVMPHHYATRFGLPLAGLGALLLAARLLDAVVDPWLGRALDRLFDRAASHALRVMAAAAAVLALSFWALFAPLVQDGAALWLWCGVALLLTTLAYSVLSIAHQAWGARLGGDESQRARIVSWREAAALAGVLVASALPSLAGLPATTAVLAVALVLALAMLWRAPRPRRPPRMLAVRASPLRTARFRVLLAVYLVNGMASAVPATLVLFFIRDRLQAPVWEPVFLGSYFAAAALSMPLWLRAVARIGLARAWLVGMGLAVLSFVGAAALGPGDLAAYLAVCLASGVALGADLVLPAALLAGVIRQAGHGGQHEGAYFGWWNFATKLNLALAAGAALPLLAMLGYVPGERSAHGLLALSLSYALLPCALKLVAAALWYRLWIRSAAA